MPWNTPPLPKAQRFIASCAANESFRAVAALKFYE
jgi:hypothetical protein